MCSYCFALLFVRHRFTSSSSRPPTGRLVASGCGTDGVLTSDNQHLSDFPLSTGEHCCIPALSEMSDHELMLIRVPQAKVLVVGAGGIGCELLKNLVLSGYGEVHVVDLDTIDLSNLNRQFLFRYEHIKKSKAQVWSVKQEGQIVTGLRTD